MADKDLKLNSLEMAQFVRNGFLRFDNIVPKELCDAAHKEMIDGTVLIRDMESGIQEVLNADKAIKEINKRLRERKA